MRATSVCPEIVWIVSGWSPGNVIDGEGGFTPEPERRRETRPRDEGKRRIVYSGLYTNK